MSAYHMQWLHHPKLFSHLPLFARGQLSVQLSRLQGTSFKQKFNTHVTLHKGKTASTVEVDTL